MKLYIVYAIVRRIFKLKRFKENYVLVNLSGTNYPFTENWSGKGRLLTTVLPRLLEVRFIRKEIKKN